MERIADICRRYDIVLCYLFGSQAESGLSILQGGTAESSDPGSDIDFAVLFKERPQNSLKTYATLSLDLQGLVSPFRADLLFLHEVDHLIQLEAIKGACIYSEDETLREEYEEKVMMFAAEELIIFKLNEKDMFEAMDNGYFEFEYKAH